MELIKLLDLANPKLIKDTLNRVLQDYGTFRTEIEEAANTALNTAVTADDTANTALALAEQSFTEASEAVQTSELAMNVANEAKSTVDQALDIGALGSFVHNVNGIALAHAHMTDDPNQADDEELSFLATPTLVREAIKGKADLTNPEQNITVQKVTFGSDSCIDFNETTKELGIAGMGNEIFMVTSEKIKICSLSEDVWIWTQGRGKNVDIEAENNILLTAYNKILLEVPDIVLNAFNKILLQAPTEITGDLSVTGRVTVPTPSENEDAVPKSYVDANLDNKVNKNSLYAHYINGYGSAGSVCFTTFDNNPTISLNNAQDLYNYLTPWQDVYLPCSGSVYISSQFSANPVCSIRKTNGSIFFRGKATDGTYNTSDMPYDINALGLIFNTISVYNQKLI